MRFWKYQGIGNDFILFDGCTGTVEVDKEACKRMCDRHYGIGADGVLYMLPGDGSDITMRIINADGSEAEMCGNGIRCLAKHAYDFGIVDKTEFTIRTMRGILTAKVTVSEGKVYMVEIDMGAPILECVKIPMSREEEKFIDRPLEAGGYVLKYTAVSMGNPHIVTFEDLDDDTMRILGPAIENHPVFPKRTNVEFARVVDGKIHVTVYERGAAWTLACGTGACATTVAAVLTERVPSGVPIDVRLPGGWLKITVENGLKSVHMAGPAELVFEGSI